jgi:hypothetical protein
MKLKPTSEQQAILDAVASKKNIAIQALAGTGKTSTLQMIAGQDSVNTLYISFNKSIAEEASTKFPNHVTCKTIHALAFAKFGSQFRKGKDSLIITFYDSSLVRDILKESLPEDEGTANKMLAFAVDIVKGFCNSNATTLEQYVEHEVPLEHQCFGKDAKTLWENLSNPKIALFSTHDVYLKLWALSKPNLGYPRVMLDEAQDTNPVCLGVFLSQKAQLIAVGDECQSIYGFRGAKNFFSNIPKDWKSCQLSESFRFGPIVASKANLILETFGKKVLGRGKDYDGVGSFDQRTYLVRNNATMMDILIAGANDGESIFCHADMKDTFKKMYHLSELWSAWVAGRQPKIKYPDRQMSSFHSWKEVEESTDGEIQKYVRITKKCTPIHSTILKIKSCLVTSEDKATIVIATGHKSKGLEWKNVHLTDDFLPETSSHSGWDNMSDAQKYNYLVESQSLQLLYVAMTRAKENLTYSKNMEAFLELLGEYKRLYDLNNQK